MLENLRKYFTTRVTYEPGNDYAGNGSIIKYDAPFLLAWGWMLPFRGSVFTMHMIEGVVITVVIASGLAFFKCEGMEIPHASNKGHCIFLPVGFSNLTLLTVASFLIGLFANTLLQRWWALRFHLHGHIGTSNEIMILLATTLANVPSVNMSAEDKVEVRQACMAVYRYLNLGNHLVIMNARKEFDYSILLNKGLLTKSEHGMLGKLSGSPNIAYSWIDATLQKLAHHGYLGEFPGIGQSNLSALLTAVGSARSHCISVGVYIDTQLPYPFVQLIAFVVHACIIQAIAVAGGTIGDAFHRHDYDVVMSSYLSLILFVLVMRAMLTIYHILANPLGDYAADLPRTAYLNNSERGLMALLNNIFELSQDPGDSATAAYSAHDCMAGKKTRLFFPPIKDDDHTPPSKPRHRSREASVDKMLNSKSFRKLLSKSRDTAKSSPNIFSRLTLTRVSFTKSKKQTAPEIENNVQALAALSRVHERGNRRGNFAHDLSETHPSTGDGAAGLGTGRGSDDDWRRHSDHGNSSQSESTSHVPLTSHVPFVGLQKPTSPSGHSQEMDTLGQFQARSKPNRGLDETLSVTPLSDGECVVKLVGHDDGNRDKDNNDDDADVDLTPQTSGRTHLRSLKSEGRGYGVEGSV